MKLLIQRNSFLLFLLLMTAAAKAQTSNDLQFNIDYNVNIPSGSFRNFIGSTAWKGFTAGLAYPLTRQLRIGLNIGYNDFYQKYGRQVYSEGAGADISAVVSNSVQQIPLLVVVDYTLLKRGLIRPYVGAGAGVNFVSFDQYLGEFDNPHSSTHFAARGEAGVLIPLSSRSATAIRVGGSYNYAPYKKDGVDNMDNWGIHAGISIPLR
jgi:opacity protein-like surface antigen